METKQRWQDWVNLVLGFWIFITPFLVGMAALSNMVAWNGYVFGVIIAALSIWALVQPRAWEEWINFLIGIWLIVSPFALGFTMHAAAMWSFIIVGFIVGADALWAALARHSPMQHA